MASMETFDFKVAAFRGSLEPLTQLCPHLKVLSIREKVLLEASDIQELGKEAEEDQAHSLNLYSSILQEEELSQDIVEAWNERHPPERSEQVSIDTRVKKSRCEKWNGSRSFTDLTSLLNSPRKLPAQLFHI